MTGQTPIWRRDFPYTTDGEDEVTRREFTRYLVLASAAFAGGGGLISLWASLRSVEAGESVAIVSLDDLHVGGSHLFDYPGPGDPAILVRPEQDLVLAFSQKCTHLTCAVIPDVEKGVIHCPCHEGFFDLESGNVLAGPPPRPLPRILLEIRGDDVYATGVEWRTV